MNWKDIVIVALMVAFIAILTAMAYDYQQDNQKIETQTQTQTQTRVFLYLLDQQKDAHRHMRNLENDGYQLVETKNPCSMGNKVVIPMIFQKESK